MKINLNNDYTPIDFSLMVFPHNIAITDETNPYFNDFDKSLAIKQYNDLVDVLRREGINFTFLDLLEAPHQVYTRDIGFTIGGKLYISNLSEEDRKTEIRPLIDLLIEKQIDFYLMEEKVEGGDVFLHNDKIFIGTGGRTTQLAVEEIRQQINQDFPIEMIKVLFDLSKIHLDCVFNILDEETCIITNGVFNPKEVTKHFTRVIKVPDGEVDILGANIINLGNNKILCSSKAFSDILKGYGYDAIYIDFSEVIKLGGGLGCCLLPISRSVYKG